MSKYNIQGLIISMAMPSFLPKSPSSDDIIYEKKNLFLGIPSTVISGGNKHMCVFYQTCVEKSQHLSVGFSDTYVVISTHVCNKTHQCGKSHIAALCVEVGFTKQVWKKPNMCGNTHIY